MYRFQTRSRSVAHAAVPKAPALHAARIAKYRRSQMV